jgi:hypothetical protein
MILQRCIVQSTSENELNIHSKEILLNFTNILNKLAKDFRKQMKKLLRYLK